MVPLSAFSIRRVLARMRSTTAVTVKTVSISSARTFSYSALKDASSHGSSAGVSLSMAARAQSAISAVTEPCGFWLNVSFSVLFRCSRT